MIVLDLESSGLDTGKCGIWQIGAIELENPENQFLEEARIDDEDFVEEGALKVTGKTEEELRDKNKQSQNQLILNFIEWAKNCKTKLIIGQNVGWDVYFLYNKCMRYKISQDFRKIMGFKYLELHTITQLKHLEIKGVYSLKEPGKSNMDLTRTLEFCGMKDKRKDVKGTDVVKKGEPHNALEDAKLTAECFSRLMDGKNLFSEYAKYEIPEELRK